MPDPRTGSDQESLVTPTQIAALVGVGRAAVSNWRRRYPDFPQPAGGTVNSPLFDWGQVEAWLAANGRAAANTPESVETRMHHGLDLGDFATLVERLAYTNKLADHTDSKYVSDLLADRPPFDVAIGLAEREAMRARSGEFGPMPKVAAIIGALLTDQPSFRPRTVLDPRCGFGSLLPSLSTWPGWSGRRCIIQDPSPYAIRITKAMLRLAHCPSVEESIVDSLSNPPEQSPKSTPDLIVCAVPFGKAQSEAAFSATDPRWVFGVPPQAAPEFAWLQHCYAQLAPGGFCALVMSSNAATNPLGRQIRSALVKSRSLQTVLTLPTGLVPGVNRSGQIWLLQRSDRHSDASTPARRTVRMTDLSHLDPAELDHVIADWRGTAGSPHLSRDVPLIDLLDGDTELLPARWLAPPTSDVTAPFREARAELMSLLSALRRAVPDLSAIPPTPEPPTAELTVGALARSGALDILPGGSTTALDDIIVNPLELDRSRIVIDPAEAGRRVKEPLIRCDPEQIDPYFLLGHLRTAANRRITGTLGSRNDVRKARIPRLGIEEQRGLAADIKTLVRFANLSARSRTLSNTLITLAFEGLSAGTLSSRADTTTESSDNSSIDPEED